ncbi:MAG: hypothetical protein MMC23_008463 [Stictis urceolatum]|nr:hypothetical protein [Stictis urceolata]
MASVQRSTAAAFLRAFEELDDGSHIALRAPNCRHTIAPASTSFHPNMTNEQWATHFASLRDVLIRFPVTAKEIFEQPASNQITVWATSEAIFREEAKDYDSGLDWTYRGEYIFILFFNQAGDRIERILEFVDSKRAAEVMILVKRARHNLQAKRSNAS